MSFDWCSYICQFQLYLGILQLPCNSFKNEVSILLPFTLGILLILLLQNLFLSNYILTLLISFPCLFFSSQAMEEDVSSFILQGYLLYIRKYSLMILAPCACTTQHAFIYANGVFVLHDLAWSVVVSHFFIFSNFCFTIN